MSFIDINWKPDHRQLRQFAWMALVALPLIGWIWGASTNVLSWLAGAGAVLVVLSYVAPVIVRPFFLGLTLVTFPIGMVVGEVVMLMIYITVFLPIALIFRLLRRDALELKVDQTKMTYWKPKKQPRSVENYYRQW